MSAFRLMFFLHAYHEADSTQTKRKAYHTITFPYSTFDLMMATESEPSSA